MNAIMFYLKQAQADVVTACQVANDDIQIDAQAVKLAINSLESAIAKLKSLTGIKGI